MCFAWQSNLLLAPKSFICSLVKKSDSKIISVLITNFLQRYFNWFKQISLKLKYVKNTPAITGIERHSTPGRRLYYGVRDIPRVLGGLGVAILTTSKGVMRARDAREQGVGGELICKVW